MYRSKVVHLAVDNKAGVLDQIALLIRRTSWNVRSISANETIDPNVTTISILLEGRGTGAKQVAEKLTELEFVRSIDFCDEEDCYSTEAALVQVQTQQVAALHSCAAEFGARKLSQSGDELLFEILGRRDCMEGFIRECMKLGSTQAIRSGPIYMQKNQGDAEHA